MNAERKRSPIPELNVGAETSFATASSSSSARSRHTFVNRSATLPPQRPGSPPASAYFSDFAGDDNHLPQAAPDAGSHFAYSTTLRRHHPEGPLAFPQTPHGAALPSFEQLRSVASEEGPSGLWDRIVGTARSFMPSDSHDYEQLPTRREETKDTPSARFAHCSAEDTISYFRTSSVDGLRSTAVPSLLASHGYNEFSVDTPEPMLLKFAKTIYERPLLLNKPN